MALFEIDGVVTKNNIRADGLKRDQAMDVRILSAINTALRHRAIARITKE